MTHVATLVATTDPPVLTDALLARLAAVLPGPGAPVWLDPGLAADIPFAPANADEIAVAPARLRDRIAGLPVDSVVQPRAGRRKKLLLADMDSTMIGQECIDELADFVGLKPHVAAITERAMRGEIAFEPALRERVALLAGLDTGVIATVIAERITLTTGGWRLVQTMRAHGAYAALVSGGFTAFTEVIAEKLGFDESRANRLLVADGKLSGEVSEPILGREAKLAALQELRARLGLAPHETLAVGDGANDLAMLKEAGLGVAFHAKPAVAVAAHARIDHSDLRALLYIQGYARGEFAEL